MIVSGRNSRAAEGIASGEEKNYQVTFGESYHNYLPGSLLRIGVVFKNSSSEGLTVCQELVVVDSAGLKRGIQ